jgi:hypothetical protein
MKISRVGVDLAKNVFQIHGADAHGKGVWKRKLTRKNCHKHQGSKGELEACQLSARYKSSTLLLRNSCASAVATCLAPNSLKWKSS